MENGRYIFTDIDGVLNPTWKRQWSRKSVGIYNRICKDFELVPILSSTWRTNHTLQQMNAIFAEQGITAKIKDFTPNLGDYRGIEIDEWLRENSWTKYVVIDDDVKNITPYVSNVIKVRGWIGLEEEHYEEVKLKLR
jgi:hypothetical protein